ncbi:hypothetical protein [Bacillus subtilis]|uniref:hypothetical protein n=1 Tax=Bacillus subtilis TaxID=1423 RepID=UPI000D676570|nr:hypothetical protein [Bacillus subtilis]MEC0453207.1 hypothetical protein [Bacillus subtilis]MEC0454599.1 hypothetical protein [Bacillus subtilis]MEC0504358.1 hypothetical protein [Bacillus subtilis]PWI61523.1 hypothetical protein DCS65_09455 [Bacillus subtilis]
MDYLKSIFDLVSFSERIADIPRSVDNIINPIVQFKEILSESRLVVDTETIIHEDLKPVLNHTANFGWTYVDHLPADELFSKELLDLNKDQIDEHFMSLYSEANKYKEDFLGTAKQFVFENVNEIHHDLLKEMYMAFEKGLYKLCIPSAILIIEGEISDIAQSSDVGKRLITKWETKLRKKNNSKFDKEKTDFMDIATYSLIKYLSERLFIGHEFEDDRLDLLNRNWILHGRDDSSLWSKTDVVRLLNTICTVVTIKDHNHQNK